MWELCGTVSYHILLLPNPRPRTFTAWHILYCVAKVAQPGPDPVVPRKARCNPSRSSFSTNFVPKKQAIHLKDIFKIILRFSMPSKR